MAPLFSRADLKKFSHDVQNEEILIFAKFGKGLFDISKVIGCKTKWPRFFGLLVGINMLNFKPHFKYSPVKCWGTPVAVWCALASLVQSPLCIKI